MTSLLALSRAIDTMNEKIGKWTAWLVLAAVLISAGNAITRKAFNLSSNGMLELQWYLFGAVFMLGAAWTMKTNEHVRVDVVSSRLSKRLRDRIEVWGLLVFFAPFVLVHVWYSFPFALNSIRSGEYSTNAGGLIIWPAKTLILVGFLLLALQGVSQLIKRIAIIRGDLQEFDEMKGHAAEAQHVVEAVSGPPAKP